VSNCYADFWAGGVASYGTLAMTNSTVIYNSSSQLGGGLNLGGTTNWLTGCTITANDCYGSGGGIFNYSGELRMLNCTLSGNWVGDMYGGGGGLGQGPTPYGSIGNSKTYVNCCTIVSNTADLRYGSSGGGVWNGGGLFDSQNSIIANNAANDFSGTLTSQGHNLIRDIDGCTIAGDPTGNLYGRDPLLGPLQENAGPTWSHALLAGSPAIDAANSISAPPVDQQGIPRPQGLASDIGAFEFEHTTPAVMQLSVQFCTNCCLELCGLRGGIYTLEASTNLVTWVDIATIIGGTNGVRAFTDLGFGQCASRFYRVKSQGPPGSVYLPAPSGIVNAPFLISITNIYQAVETDLPGSGRAEYPFNLATAGNYVIQTTVNATNTGANSFFVNIDAEPQDPYMIWDIPVTAGFQQRVVSWRGNGTPEKDDFVPMVFALAQGAHQLIIRGREASTLLQDIIIMPYP
jgi:hypothetical protein